jgi:hypothetical protein
VNIILVYDGARFFRAGGAPPVTGQHFAPPGFGKYTLWRKIIQFLAFGPRPVRP